MKIYWLFLIPAIVCALFADKIDKAVNANKKLKKIILVFGAISLLLWFVFVMASIFYK